jgi:AmmeMemoRadiSam system protein B
LNRPPAVAGSFYPSKPEELRAFIESVLEGVPEKRVCVLAPHAGYVYSGGVAGKVYGATKIPRRVVILGPNHTGAGPSYSVYPRGVWLTPLGEVEVDSEFAWEFSSATRNLVFPDYQAHVFEHSVEVQLPFLKYLREEVTVVPVVIKDWDFERAKEVGSALARVVKRVDGETLLLISSDMNHYESLDTTLRKEKPVIEAMKELDVEAFWSLVVERNVSMCGAVPAVVGLTAAWELGARMGTVVAYSNSGEVNGDFSQVVSYLGMVFD